MDLKLKALLSGLSTHIPWLDHTRFTGGTDSARYCYSVWLRHLVLGARRAGMRAHPKVVAELGPGDSIGIGLAALLSGAEKYFALDLVRYSELEKNLAILDELVALFSARSSIPDDAEFPHMYPKLDSYEFPSSLIDSAELAMSMSEARLAAIRLALHDADTPGSIVSYKAPWIAPDVIDDGTVDYIFSQAVLEHVDDLAGVYGAMHRWLKPAGFMTHQIDFKCHGKANTWNGHWTYSDFEWKVIVGRRSYLLNRQPHSVHVRLLQSQGFKILEDDLQREESTLSRGQLDTRFRDLSEEDLTTSGAFIVAVPALEA